MSARNRSTGQRRAGSSVLVVLALIAAACSDGDGAETVDALGDGSLGIIEVAAGARLRIATVFALSGDVGSGPTNLNVVRLAVDDFGSIHGFDVDLGEPVDESCSPEGGRRAGRTIAADGDVVGVIGTSCSAAAVTAAPLVTGAGMVMISPSNTSPVLTSDLAGNPSPNHNEGYYRTAHNDLHQGAAAARFLHDEMGVTAVAVIHNGDAYTQSLAGAFIDTAEERGGEITGVAVVDREQTDMVPTLTDLAAGSPQALFFPVSRVVARSIVQQLPQVAGLADVLLMGGEGLLDEQFMRLEQTEGMFFSSPDIRFGDNANQRTGVTAAELLERYQESYGEAPDGAFWGHAYDATVLLLEAIEAASRPDGGALVIDRAGVREYLDGLSGYGGIIGPITCDRFGDCGVPVIVVIEHLDADAVTASRTNVVYEYTP